MVVDRVGLSKVSLDRKAVNCSAEDKKNFEHDGPR